MDGFTYAGKLIPKGKHIDVLAHLRIGHPLRLDFFMIELHRSIVFRYFSNFYSIIYKLIKCGSSSMP